MHVAIIGATAALGGLLFGYNTSVISGALLSLRVTLHLSSLIVGVVTRIALADAPGGASIAGRLTDRLGRRPIMLATFAVLRYGHQSRPRWRAASPRSSLAACSSGSESAARPRLHSIYLAEIARRKPYPKAGSFVPRHGCC